MANVLLNFFPGMISDVPAFKVRLFAGDFGF